MCSGVAERLTGCALTTPNYHQQRVAAMHLLAALARFLAGPRKSSLAGVQRAKHVAPVKIGLLGGSFDPVHFGHLLAAQDAFEQHHLDRLILVPAAQAPLKPNDVQSSAEDRLAMLRASTEWDKRFEISDFELRRGGVSYTIDSARYFRSLYPNDSLYWIVGGDQLPKLHLWKDIGELVRLVEFIFLERPGYPVKAQPAIPGLTLHRCDGHLLGVSSTELRERTRRGLSLDYFVPHKAIVYIQERRLYREAT
jgi:nicotinate-nucleotide adenylyltransferase